jgi:hypothetical protein
MSITRKLALPAAALTTAVIAQGPGTASAATVSHRSDKPTPARLTPPRRARAVDILNRSPDGIRPDTFTTSNTSLSTRIRFKIYGAEAFVSDATATGCVLPPFNYSWPAAHVEIQKPNGTAYKNGTTGRMWSKDACRPTVSGHPDISDAGAWKAIVWDKFSSGYYFNVVSTHIDVA